METAIEIRDPHGGTVTVLTMGPPKADKALREAISMGCDSAVLLSDRAFAGIRFHPMLNSISVEVSIQPETFIHDSGAGSAAPARQRS